MEENRYISEKESTDDEMLEVVDVDGRFIRLARRAEVHSDPTLLHRVVHVLIFDRRGRLLLQRRSLNKDMSPGLWDTSVGGHINPGESAADAALREMHEELGISGSRPGFLYSYLFSNSRESELVSTFLCVYEGPISFNTDEISDVRYWEFSEIEAGISNGGLSPHFATEFGRLIGSLRSDHASVRPEDILMQLEVQTHIEPVFDDPPR